MRTQKGRWRFGAASPPLGLLTTLPDKEEAKLITALIVISTGAYTGVEDVQALGVSEDVGHKLLACYDQLGEE